MLVTLLKQESLGHLSVGAVADLAVLRLERGRFGFLDMHGARLGASQRLVCELTLKDGKVAYDLNGLASSEWTSSPQDYTAATAAAPR